MEDSNLFDNLSLHGAHLFTVFVRIGAIVFFLPGFGESYVPSRIKFIVAVSFTALVFPIIAPTLNEISKLGTITVGVILSEALVGVFWGAIIRMLIFTLQIAGAIMSQATSLAQIFGGTANMDAQPAIAHILVISGVALLSIIGVQDTYLIYIVNTYKVAPVGSVLSGSDAASYSSSIVAKTFAMAFQIAAAVLTASLLYNIILGVINRAMPQLLVSFVGAPAIMAGGLLLLFIMAPTLMDVWLEFAWTIIMIPEAP